MTTEYVCGFCGEKGDAETIRGWWITDPARKKKLDGIPKPRCDDCVAAAKKAGYVVEGPVE